MSRFYVLSLIVMLPVMLVGCGSKPEPTLQGERISVLPGRVELKAGNYADGVAVELPEAFANADWPQVGGNGLHAPQHLKIAESVREIWSRSIGGGSDSEKLLNPPVVAGGMLFALSPEGYVVALNAETGREVWQTKLRTEEKGHLLFSGGLAVQGQTVFVTTGTGEVFALSTDAGKLRWRISVGVPVRTAPSVGEVGQPVFVVGHNNRLFALDAETGALKWTHSGIEEDLVLIGGGAAAVAGPAVVAPYSSGEIYARSAADGRYVWHDALAVTVGADPLSALVDVEAPPVISTDGVVYAVNHNGRLTAFRIQDGLRLWERELSAVQMPWLAGNALFIVTEGNQLVSLDREKGQTIWVRNLDDGVERKRGEPRQWAGPVLAGGRLFVASSDGYAATIDPRNGKPVRLTKLPDGVNIAPIVAEGAIYFMTQGGRIVAYR